MQSYLYTEHLRDVENKKKGIEVDQKKLEEEQRWAKAMKDPKQKAEIEAAEKKKKYEKMMNRFKSKVREIMYQHLQEQITLNEKLIEKRATAKMAAMSLNPNGVETFNPAG